MPARADPPPDPAARLQLFIQVVHVNDDHDWFGGNDFGWDATLRAIDGPPAGLSTGECCIHVSTGEEATLNRPVPRSDHEVSGGATLAAGMPVYAGHQYELSFRLSYTTQFEGNFVVLGPATVMLDEGNNWGIGTFTARDSENNDFEVTGEIRRVPLPELLIRTLHEINAGDGQFICAVIQNLGERPSAPVPLAVRADGALVRAITLSALDEGQTTEHCVVRTELPARQHQLRFIVDEARQIPEMNETDNAYEWKIQAVAPAGAASPAQSASSDGGATAPPEAQPKPGEGQEPKPQPEPKPTGGPVGPSKGQADLTVREVRLNGQVPDGKDDCGDGKNTVTVVLKNAGQGDAGSFAVRLAVDGDTRDATVDGLDAGQEREVRFDGIPLKKGEHTIKAVADPERALAEARDGNNELKVTARCKDAAPS